MPRERSRGWGADVSELTSLMRDFQDVPAKLRPAIRREVAAAGKGFTDAVKADASWSSRIPGAVKIKTSFAQRGAGVRVFVDSKAAPHARPYEGLAPGGNRNAFRHPVYGNREVWVTQATRPFFAKNIAPHRAKFLDALQTALIKTLPRR
jgi:hypothetical protein